MSCTPAAAHLAELIRDIPDFPQPGVIFKDLTPVFADATAWAAVIDEMARPHHGQFDVVVGIEARGFILGAALAYRLGVGFVPLRKAGKLPGHTIGGEYQLEYGTARLEIHADALRPGQRVLLVDDVLATGGTAQAACDIVEQAGAVLAGIDIVVEICALGGRRQLADRPLRVLLSA